VFFVIAPIILKKGSESSSQSRTDARPDLAGRLGFRDSAVLAVLVRMPS